MWGDIGVASLLVQMRRIFGCLWSLLLKLSLRALVLLVVLVSREEYSLTVRMADRIGLLSCAFLGLLRRTRSGPKIVGNVIASTA